MKRSIRQICFMATLTKVVSGGQTGADRAAHDAAMRCQLSIGGFVPKGRRDEAGTIPVKYIGLVETSTEDWRERTFRNVEASSKTLIFTRGPAIGGTRLTLQYAVRINRPFLVIDLRVHSLSKAADIIASWLRATPGHVLNVAGARASEDPKIREDVERVLMEAFRALPARDADERREALANFRHWDTVRWSAICWYLGLSAPASLLAIGGDALAVIKSMACFLMGVLGALSFFLIRNTQKYHSSASRLFPGGYAGVDFAFSKAFGWKTATEVAKWIVAAISVLWFVVAIALLFVPSDWTSGARPTTKMSVQISGR